MAHNCFCYLIWSVTFNLNMMNLKKKANEVHPPKKKINPPKKQNQKNLQKTKKKLYQLVVKNIMPSCMTSI